MFLIKVVTPYILGWREYLRSRMNRCCKDVLCCNFNIYEISANSGTSFGFIMEMNSVAVLALLHMLHRCETWAQMARMGSLRCAQGHRESGPTMPRRTLTLDLEYL
jgi:hypothetical protein